MARIFSYVLRYDDGTAPNPFWGVCTLAICKPVIRRTAQIGDWVIGTGSKNAKCNNSVIADLSDSLVYAMKISNSVTLQEYDNYCKINLKNKIPDWNAKDWKYKMGDCIYDFSTIEPEIRGFIHNKDNQETDLSGHNALLSDKFYYFGEDARPIPDNLKQLIKKRART